MPILDSAARVAPGIAGPTTTIHFCGLGGSTAGALRAGLRPLLAVNHDAGVCRVHERNFPGVYTDCADLSQTDPERYAPTDIYQGSPSCTNHSLAAGARRKRRRRQIELFAERGRPILDDPTDQAERSRATMFCVVDHAEVHQYPLILAENVVDAVRWVNWDTFLEAMRRLGYRRQRLLSINAAFIGGSPQCRDRLHIVFVRDDVPMPRLDLEPMAPCPRCQCDQPARQAWKSRSFAGTGHTVGKYGVQYIYACSHCETPVVPYFRSALGAIDLDAHAPTIDELGGDLSETMQIRIRKGLARFGPVPMLLTNNCTTHNGRVRSLLDVAFTQTGSNTTAVLLPPAGDEEDDLPDAAWCDARNPRREGGLRSVVRSTSAVIEPADEQRARKLYASARRHAHDLGSWRYRLLSPSERLVLQGFEPGHHVEGDYKQVHLMCGNANPVRVESELAARAGAALMPELYPEDLRPVAA